MLAINGNATSRVFHVGSGTTATISGLTITNGNAAGGNGGGIYNDQATLTVTNSTISASQPCQLRAGASTTTPAR